MDSKDRLQQIWERQQKFDSRLNPDVYDGRATMDRKVARAIECHALTTIELGEALMEFPWQQHKLVKKPFNRPAFVEEMVDVLKFYINFCSCAGITADELASEFNRKSDIVETKLWVQEGLARLKAEGKPIVVINLDTVIADSEPAFVRYAINWLAQNHNIKVDAYSADDLVNRLRDHFPDGGSKVVWPILKDDFNSSIALGCVPAAPGAGFLVEACMAKGWNVLLVTKRDFKRYASIGPLTMQWVNGWCHNNRLQVATMFEQDFTHLSADDYPVRLVIDVTGAKNIDLAREVGCIPCIAVGSEGVGGPGIMRVDNLGELNGIVERVLDAALRAYDKEHGKEGNND